MAHEIERLQILEMIEKGIISAEEGVRLLNSLQGEAGEMLPPQVASASTETETSASAPEPEVIRSAPAENEKDSAAKTLFDSEIKKWRRWWWVPLTVGIIITVASGLLMFLAYQKSGFGFWFACLWFPLILGVVVLSLGAASRTMRWLHVRIHQEPGEWPQTIAISMPVPLRFVAWILRIFGPYIPRMDTTNLDEVFLALEKTSSDQPFYVKVDEGESGEKVEVFIG
jgi:hypothetical protein